MSLVQCLEPFRIRVPLVEPCGPIVSRKLQVWIFKDLQRQTSLPTDCLELHAPTRVLAEIADRKIPETQPTRCVSTRQQKRLAISARGDPHHVFIDVALV